MTHTTNTSLSALELAKKLHNRDITAVSLVEHTFQHIEESDPRIQAYVSLLKDTALEQAQHIDARLDKGDIRSSLAGVPIGIKDNICIKNTRTTCSSKMLENYVSPYTATAAQQLIDNDLIPVGKLNMDEFAMGSSTENSALFNTKNPWNTDTVPGGSSGGSAATVSAGQVPLSLGSDTGGSIRQPAAYCGVVGLKPTYGRVSRYGLVAFASSLDQIGPFSRTVEEAAHILNLICGHDPHDATSIQSSVPDFTQSLQSDIKGLKIAIPKELMALELPDAVRESTEKALDVYRSLGATIDTVSMSSVIAGIASYYVIAPAEASANLARYDGVRYTYRSEKADTLHEMIINSRGEAFGEEVKRRILIGTFVLSSGYYDAYYVKAQKARTIIKQDFQRIFADYDVIATPTTPSAAFKFGAKSKDPLSMYMNDIMTIPANMAGIPAMSIPCGFSDGLPLGLQLMGNVLDEASILRAGYAFQQATDFHQQHPGESQ